jgi:hypothetical protein
MHLIDHNFKSNMCQPSKPPPAKLLEARLGFNFHFGIARDPRARRIPEIFDLTRRLDEINTRYVSYKIARTHESKGIRRRSLQILEDLGPTLWPDLDDSEQLTSWSPWLFDPSDDSNFTDNSLIKEWPIRLFFSDPTDREL